MRIFERVVLGTPKEDPEFIHSLEDARDSVQFDVTNVFQYIAALDEKSREKVLISDLPCITPPFDRVWLEYDTAGDFPSEIVNWHRGCLADRVGTLIVTYPFDDAMQRLLNLESRGVVLDREVQWVLDVQQFYGKSQDRNVSVWFAHRFLMLDAEGQIARNSKTGKIISTVLPYESLKDAEKPEGWDQETQTLNRYTYLAPLFALSLLHCKNVQVVEERDTRSRQQRREDSRKGIQRFTFKTLIIEPMKTVLSVEGSVEQHGLKKALHICRGHFANYAEDKPLFGKYSGRFWRPSHVRGSAERGAVVKDYKVKAPKGSA